MTSPTATLAETLEPPFVAAIMSDTSIVEHLKECKRRPSDELVSLAPAQEGFLGLETARDDKGRWISVSYWRDMVSFTNWRKTGAAVLAEVFPGSHLENLCQIRVANVEEPVVQARSRPLKADDPVMTSAAAHLRASRLFSHLPSLKGLLRHVHVR